MLATYTLEIECGCPADGLPDRYLCTIQAQRTIPVEVILDRCRPLYNCRMYQEDIGDRLARELNAYVVLEGLHTGIKVRSEHGLSPCCCS